MRFAVLSDIHSNYAALRAVIADAESRQPDYWLFLGDYVTDCPTRTARWSSCGISRKLTPVL